ncbi:putative 3-hydroxyisobutyryl-CoA hydrolase [Streptomyces afghaniensis 772]|uniref:3-hydroxyisobutyryl-CoA hydrolase n=1 Tax=Streptomyces afghaniensis 772 TaxID=1283301 RepID=S4MEP9_9ACTN|nr:MULTISPECIES: enoyl-CoA hydratase/isomerase family protein [Streptomyces]EPJ34896.1 putative 3-hydroxyisobutyryl-CoA hydrolase [Streptomyces afghaniensis 772]UOB15139.1 enoyl-CoA hydratase/isomerase family protein [Streptomyces sp. HP-A2021]
MTDTAAVEVLADVHRGVGRILLNRPKALNALTTDMVAAIDRVLAEWEHTPLSAVVLASTSTKAFCAGGDIRTIREHSLAGDAEASERFFASEYRLNARIAEYPVPVVSLIDGVCMGGGLGLSVHGSFRVVTESAVLAMPETGIGFFPDVGASYFLPRLPGAIGMYLGLTGHRLDAADALYTGLATHFVPRDGLDAVADALADNAGDPVDVVLNRLAGRSPVAESGLAKVRGDLDRAFGAATVGEIEKRLRHLDTPWAAAALVALESASPQSLEITHALLARGRQRTLRECLGAELALTRTTIRTPDFLEGVRAALVDKDRTPDWQRASLGERTLPS